MLHFNKDECSLWRTQIKIFPRILLLFFFKMRFFLATVFEFVYVITALVFWFIKSKYLFERSLLNFTLHVNWASKFQLNSKSWGHNFSQNAKQKLSVFRPWKLEGRAKILVIFGWHFGRNDDLINSFWPLQSRSKHYFLTLKHLLV